MSDAVVGVVRPAAHPTNSPWRLYFHSPEDSKWDKSSFTLVATVSTIEQYWALTAAVGAEVIENGMLFLMRGDIPPLWEHFSNRGALTYSMRIPRAAAVDAWNSYAVAAVAECLLQTPDYVHGVSISPKKGHAILKIWNKSAKDRNVAGVPCLHKEIRASEIVARDNIDQRM